MQLSVDRMLIDGCRRVGGARRWVSRQTRLVRRPHRHGPHDVADIVAARLATLYGPHRLACALGRLRSTTCGTLSREGFLASASPTGRPGASLCATNGPGP
jgi:hypothetical protein